MMSSCDTLLKRSSLKSMITMWFKNSWCNILMSKLLLVVMGQSC